MFRLQFVEVEEVEPQSGSALQPRVAASGYPGDRFEINSNPKGVASIPWI
jgi:hypothetical protein